MTETYAADDFAYIRQRMSEIAEDRRSMAFWSNIEYPWSFHSAPPQYTYDYNEIDDLEVLIDCPPRHVDLVMTVEGFVRL